MPSHGHNYSGHIFIAPGNSNTSIVELCASDGLDTVGYDFTSLETETHTLTTHSNCIRNANGVVLPTQHASSPDSIANGFTKIVH